MNNLNSILIEGNIVRDPLLRNTPKGSSVCSFSIASNRYYKQGSGFEKEVGFFEVETWGKLAEACAEHGRKGRGVRVVGRLKQDRWLGSDGKNHTRVAIVAEHVEYRSDFKKAENQQSGAETADQALEESAISCEFEDIKAEHLQAAVF
ncbi:MAG: single-stranded DNA-binding protein [Treponema sp.]|jgi:single-strand DNA-binding protein|nr:single-stranded DNA-binding protein [Treponema sp.]